MNCNIVVTFIVIGLAVCQALPTRQLDSREIDSVDKLHDIINRLKNGADLKSLRTGSDIKNYRSQEGEKFYGESDAQFFIETNVNGQREERSGGHRVVNDNGRVQEVDYKPHKPPEFPELARKFETF